MKSRLFTLLSLSLVVISLMLLTSCDKGKEFYFNSEEYQVEENKTVTINWTFGKKVKAEEVQIKVADENVGTIDGSIASGTINFKALSVGSTTVTMTYKDLTAAVKVTVTEKPYELFAFEEDSYEVEYEQTLRVKMSLDERIDLEKMVYESSNPEIAKFEYGRITGMSEGEATITIKYPDKNLSKSVKVVVKLSALELGRKEKAEEFNKKVNAIQAITIDNIEEVEALILEYDGYNESILRYVTVGEKVEKMKNESKVLVIINQIDKLPEVVTPEDSKQIALARVTYENAPSEIKAQITNLARLEAKEVELEQAIFDAIPESIRLEVNAGDLLKVNGSIELNVSTVKPATVEKLVWTSSDESIATVAAGKVTGKKAGIAKITASNAGKEESSIYVTVYNASDISDEALA